MVGVPRRPGLPDIVLASGSPRRQELLATLVPIFTITPAQIDETPLPCEGPADLVARLAREKAAAVAAEVPAALVIGADTVGVLDGEILGKPAGEAQNREYLEALSARTHTVYTGHALLLEGEVAARVRETRVTFRKIAPAEMERYARSGEGFDKAGGYGIQGKGAAFIDGIEGCYMNVVGMSLVTVVELAKELGVELV